jgi:oxygen-independent coproporphyrinogen-3 oxidase
MEMPFPPLSLYVHLPWCVRKCPYCDFNSHKAGANPPRDRYIKALLLDLARESEKAAGRPLVSIFLGGGTPSLFRADEIARLLDEGLAGFALADDCEITMEANPGTLEHGKLADYRRAGVNRLSIGAQSFSAAMLAALGRIHGPQEIITAYTEASEAGFNSINLDIMFALPGQDLALALKDVEQLLALSPPHISYYQLTLEPNTVFFTRPPARMPDEDLSFAIQQACQQRLSDAGYRQYEISAFAKEGHRCRHNLNYWTFGDYLAAGAGAHGKLTDRECRVWRYRKPANPLAYMEMATGNVLDDKAHRLAPADLGFEFMLNSLRLMDGFSARDFTDRTGLQFSLLREPLERASRDGIIEHVGQGLWRPTQQGFRFLNDLQARFLP